MKLICGSETLKDSDTLARHCPEGVTVLRMMLVMSLDEARKRLDHASRHTRQDALKAFAQMAPKGNRGAVAAIGALLGDDASEVRTSALEALARVAAEGDDRAIELALGCLRDVRADVRCAALQVLTQLAPAGHKGVAGALADCLADRDKSVRAAAFKQFVKWAPKGDADAVQAAIIHLKSER